MNFFAAFIKTIILTCFLFLLPTLVDAQSCAGTTTLTATTGTFNDGSGTSNYINNLNCSWLIQPTGSPLRIELNMTSMNLSFFNDRVRVYDGTNNAGTLLGTYTGNNIGGILVAFSGSMFVEFTTDNFGNAQGWDASYTSTSSYCQQGVVFSNNLGAFTDGSPNGTNYLDSTNCEWLIQTVTPNQLVRLTFSRFDTESGKDFLTIYDGTTTGSPILGTFSGSSIPSAILSSGGDMLVTFHSDSTNTANGWRAIYEIVPAPTCSGMTTLSATSGTFDDGSGTGLNYTDNLTCSWLIQPAGATMINLNFTQFDTETGFDFVTVYDGPNNTSPVLGTYSGATVPLGINSSGGSLFIEFTSDQAVNETGWEATYNSSSNQCFSNLQLTSLNGSISDGSGTSNYTNNLNCSWVIQPSLATSISTNFSNFDLSIGDTLFIYDGLTASDPLLGAYTGSSLPSSVTSTAGEMFIEFITNTSTNSMGWDLSYSSTTASSCAGQTNLTAASGSFSDGSGTANYDNNLNCTWLIQPIGSPASITLTMSNVNLTGFNDVVRVYDGANNGGTLLGTIRFNNPGNPLVAYSGSMFVEFTTSNANTAQGWDASYITANTLCQPNTVLSNNNGGFTDGSRNGVNYLNNTDCEWLIQPPLANVAIRLNFGRFTAAPNDTLFIYDGTSSSAPLLAAYTSNSIVNGITSSGRSMFLKFKTDSINTANGWYVTYNTQTIPFCNGVTNLTAPSGSFTDGSPTSTQYVPNSNCSWLINPPGAISVSLSFSYFATQTNFDEVRIYQGSDNSGLLLGAFSGNALPPSLSSATGEMFVQFTTSNQTNATGWGASYTSSNQTIIDAVPDTVYLNAGAGNTTSFQLNSNTSWTTSDNQNWLISTPFSGSLNSTINLLAVQGNIGPERSALVFVDATINSTRDTVVVIQRSSGRFLSSSPDTLFFGSTPASNQMASLTTNVNWTLSSSSNWINFTPNSGNNNASISVGVSNNTVNQERQGSIIVSGNLGVTNDTIVIIQDSLAYAMSVTPQNITLNSTAGSNDSVQLSANLSWTASTSETWLSLSSNSGNDSSRIIITANTDAPSTRVRSAYVLFSAGNGRFSDTVYVSQLGITPKLETNPDTLFFDRVSGDSNVLTITSTGNWITTFDNTLFTSSQVDGTGNGSLTITSLTTNNTLLDIVSSFIVLDTTDNLTDTITLVQAGVTGTISTSPDSILLTYTNGSSATFDVASSISWSVNNPAGWLTVSPNTGNGNSTITVTANSENQTGADRVAMVIVNGIGNLSDTVIVTQRDASFPRFNTSMDTLKIANQQGSSGTFSILSNITWTLNENTVWLAITPTSGSSDQSITALVIESNLNSQSRYAPITASASGFPDKTIIIEQLGVAAVAQFSPDSLIIGADSTSFGTISINSNLNSWSVSENAAWLVLNRSTGSFSNDVIATAIERNLTGLPRSTIVTLTAPPLAPQDIKVIQDTNMSIGLDENIFQQSIVLYPNPTSGNVTVKIGENYVGNTIQTSLFNIVGEELAIDVNFTTNAKTNIDLGHLPNGVYFLHIRYKEEIYTTKISLLR